jgi:hypothetical protein
MVIVLGAERKRLVDTSPKEVTAAKTAPAIIPGRISGSVTLKKVVAGPAPKLIDANSKEGLMLETLTPTDRTT